MPDQPPSGRSIRLFGRLGHFLSASGPKLLKDLFSLVTGQLAAMILGFVAFSYLARTLSVELYGTVEFIVSLAAFAAIFIECGVGMIAVREMAKDGASPSRIATATVTARGLIAFIVAPLFALGVFLTDLPNEISGIMLLYALSLLFLPLRQEWFLQAREHMRLAALGQPLRGVIFTLIVVFLVTSNDSLIWVGFAEVAAVLILVVYYVIAQYVLGTAFDWRAASGRTMYYVREGLAIGLSNILWAFMIYAPMFFLVTLSDNASETAWLGASQRIVIAMVTTSFLYHFNLYPVIARTLIHDRDAWQKIVQSSVHLAAWGGFGVALVCACLSPLIITLIFGDKFAAAAPVFATLVWAFPLRFLSGHARWSLVADGKQNWLLGAEVAGAGALIVTAVLAIPSFGAVGASGALIAGIFVSGAITQAGAEKSLGRFRLTHNALPAALAAAASIIAGTTVSSDPLLQTATSIVVFGGCMALTAKKLKNDLIRIAYSKAQR